MDDGLTTPTHEQRARFGGPSVVPERTYFQVSAVEYPEELPVE